MPNISTTAKPIQLLTDIRKRPWFVYGHESLVPSALAILRGDNTPAALARAENYAYSIHEAEFATSEQPTSNKVAVIPIVGVIVKYDTLCSYGAETYAKAIRQEADNSNVCAIILDIDSPGGVVNAIAPLKEAVIYARAKGKPVIAHVDTCASLAYWLASQCDAIFCDSPLSTVGSIGAMCQLIDDTGALEKEGYKVVTVYADESPDKNLVYRKAIEDDPSLLKGELSYLVAIFHSDVKAGRPEIKADAPGVFTGAMFNPGEAQALGMVNGELTLSECIENAAIRAQINQIT